MTYEEYSAWASSRCQVLPTDWSRFGELDLPTIIPASDEACPVTVRSHGDNYVLEPVNETQ